MGQLNSSLLPTVTHAIKPSALIFFSSPSPPYCACKYTGSRHTYVQAPYSSGVLYGHMPAPRTHKCDCLKQQQSVPRALGFPSELRGFWVKSLHTQPRLVRSHMQACWLSLWDRTRSVSYEWICIINFCFLKLFCVLLPVLLLNSQPRSLQRPPTRSHISFLATIFNADQASGWQNSPPPLWLFIPGNHASPTPLPSTFFSFLLSLLWLIIISKLGFVSYDGQLEGSYQLCLLKVCKPGVAKLKVKAKMHHWICREHELGRNHQKTKNKSLWSSNGIELFIEMTPKIQKWTKYSYFMT